MISYQSGKKNDKANGLTKKLNEQSTNDEDKRRKHSIRMLLSPSHIASAKLQPIEESEKNEENHAN